MQTWPDQFGLTLHPDDNELRFRGHLVAILRPRETRIVHVLLRNFPRWMLASDIFEEAYSDIPDADANHKSSVSASMADIRKAVGKVHFDVQYEHSKGYRLVNHDVIAKEARLREAEIDSIPQTGLGDLARAIIDEELRRKAEAKKRKFLRQKKRNQEKRAEKEKLKNGN